MALPRIIPVLLLNEDGLVKTIKFKNPNYLGDPINAVKIFNDKLADEIIILDITASMLGGKPNFGLIEDIGAEAFMPFAYGGGISSIEEGLRILKAGAEKLILNSIVLQKEEVIRELSKLIGSSSTVVSIDIKKNLFGRYKVFSQRGSKNMNLDPIEHAKRMIEFGVGEIFLNFIDLDGMMCGYDMGYSKLFAQSLDVPVVVCGGSRSYDDFTDMFRNTQVSGCAAGSVFIYNGPLRGYLINYPNVEELSDKLKL
jgi:cyclase